MSEQNNINPHQTFLLSLNGEEMMAYNEVVDVTILNNDSAVHKHLPFVHKLYLILQDMEAKGHDHIISWIGDGKAFKIHNPSLFEASIQRKYFRQSRVASFIRQVSLEFFARQTFSIGCRSHSCWFHVPILFSAIWVRFCQDRRQKQHIFWGVCASRLSQRSPNASVYDRKATYSSR